MEDKKRRCPECQAELGPQERVCPACGASLVSASGGQPADASKEKAGQKKVLRCVRCRAEVAPDEALVLRGWRRGGPPVLCPTCVAELEALYAAETQDLQVGRGALFGLAATLVIGIGWYAIEHFGRWPFPLMALIGGAAIAELVGYGAGRKRGKVLQQIALGLTALLILGTQYAVLSQSASGEFAVAFVHRLQDPLTVVLYGAGLLQAYSALAPRTLARKRR